MDTLISEERNVEVATAPLPFLARLALWYRQAVIEPATEKEEAEWQQNSF